MRFLENWPSQESATERRSRRAFLHGLDPKADVAPFEVTVIKLTF